MSNYLGQAWDAFFEEVLRPINPGMTQTVETRRAFYAGANVLFELVATGSQNLPEEAAMQMMTNIQEEFERFARDLRRGRA